MGPLKFLLGAAGVLTGANMIGKLFGSDRDFSNAWMINQMTGQGGGGPMSSFFKTYFSDGMSSMFLGSRSMAATMGAYRHMGMMGMGMGGYPMGCSLYGGPMGFSPHMMNPYGMGGMPYAPMAGFGCHAWL